MQFGRDWSGRHHLPMTERLGRWGGLAAALLVLSTGTADAQFGPAPISVSPVVQRKVAAGQTFVGTVMPLRKSTIGSAVDGRIVEFHVNEGDYVKKGDVLAQILTGTIEIELAEAKAELQLRREELAELKNGSREEEKKHAEAHMRGMQARKEYTEARLRRIEMLYEKKTLSKEDLDEAAASSAEAAQAFYEAEATWRLAVEGPRKEKIAQMQAKVLTQEEAVHHIEDRLAKYTIKAYFDGFVVQEFTEVGHWVRTGEPVVEVVALDQVDVRVPVLENYVPYLRQGASVRVDVTALPERTFLGAVHVIVPQADQRSRSFPVDIRIQNSMENNVPLLKAGMFAQVTLPVGKPEDSLLVSKDAVVLGGPAPMVYALVPDPKDAKRGKVRPVPIELGVADGSLIQVRGVLKAGEQVVVRGNERLRPDQEVMVVEVLALQGSAAPPSKAVSP
jgi:RND family efflux transporter MFP subunit